MDVDDPVVSAVYEQRATMKASDWLFVATEHFPVQWWAQQNSEIQEYAAAQRAINNAFSKTQLLLQNGTLSATERTELEKFLRMLAAESGPLKIRDKANYFFSQYLPWCQFVSRLLVDHPYKVFLWSWVIIFLNSIILTYAHNSAPIFWTYAIVLILTGLLTLSVYEKDRTGIGRKGGLGKTVRFSALFPVILLLWLAVAVISLFGQLPLGIDADPVLVVSRNGNIQRVITVNTPIVRYPNTWETFVRGYAIRSFPEFKTSHNLDRKIPKLREGALTVTITSVLRSPFDLKGNNYYSLPQERERLVEKAKEVIKQWCDNFEVGTTAPSLPSLITRLSSQNFDLYVPNPVKVSWVEEKIVPVEKEVEKIEKVKAVVNEKQSTPKDLVIN